MARGRRRAPSNAEGSQAPTGTEAGSSQPPTPSAPPTERFSDLLWYPHAAHRVSLASAQVR